MFSVTRTLHSLLRCQRGVGGVSGQRFWLAQRRTATNPSRKAAVVYQQVLGRDDQWNAIASDGDVVARQSLPLLRRTASAGAAPAPSPSAETWEHVLFRLFFPKDYPRSVTNNYLPYSAWQFVQYSSGTMASVLSTQSMLFAVGLGAGAIPLAAAINWILKDGLGQLGGVLYGMFFASKFDSDPKRQRFLATIALQVSTCVELITPLVPHLFLPLAALSNAGKNVSWIASSATRAHMNQSLTLHDNLGDVTAKCTSQAIASAVVGTAFGVICSSLIGSETFSVFCAFLPLSLINIYSNYRSNMLIRLHTLNVQRAERVFYSILSSQLETLNFALKHRTTELRFEDAIECPTIEEISKEETFVRAHKSAFKVPIVIDGNVSNVLRSADWEGRETLKRAFETQSESHYVLTLANHHDLPHCHLWLDHSASGPQSVFAFFVASLVRSLRENENSAHFDSISLIEFAQRLAHQMWPNVQKALLAQNWSLEFVFFRGDAPIAFVKKIDDV